MGTPNARGTVVSDATPLIEYRDAVVARLKAALPPVVDIAVHHGRLDEAEVTRIALAAPAVRVTVLGVDGLDNRGGSNAGTSVGVFVVTGVGKGGQSPTDAALALVAAVLAAIDGQRFGDASAPASVRAENYSSGEMAANNTCLWAVTWKAGVDVSNAIAAPVLDDFLRCYVRDRADADPSLTINLPGPWPEQGA